MGDLLNNQRQTKSGNRYYEFKRVPEQELQDYRISVYDYLA